MTVGFIGLGRMGAAIARRLLEANVPLVVWNRSPRAAEPLRTAGAGVAADPQAVAEACDVVFTSLTDDTAVRSVFTASSGLLDQLRPNALIVEMSTLRPTTIGELCALTTQAGGRLVDCPVVGSVGHAAAGQLLALAGGAAADVDEVRPLLDAFCRRVVSAGPSGSGSALKLVMNQMTGGYLALLAEALALGRAHGLSLDMMVDTLADGPTACPVLKGKTPVILGQDTAVGFDIASMAKDLLSIVSAGGARGVPMPAAGAAGAAYATAAAGGWGAADIGRLPAFASERMIEVWRRPKGAAE